MGSNWWWGVSNRCFPLFLSPQVQGCCLRKGSYHHWVVRFLRGLTWLLGPWLVYVRSLDPPHCHTCVWSVWGVRPMAYVLWHLRNVMICVCNYVINGNHIYIKYIWTLSWDHVRFGFKWRYRVTITIGYLANKVGPFKRDWSNFISSHITFHLIKHQQTMASRSKIHPPHHLPNDGIFNPFLGASHRQHLSLLVDRDLPMTWAAASWSGQAPTIILRYCSSLHACTN